MMQPLRLGGVFQRQLPRANRYGCNHWLVLRTYMALFCRSREDPELPGWVVRDGQSRYFVIVMDMFPPRLLSWLGHGCNNACPVRPSNQQLWFVTATLGIPSSGLLRRFISRPLTAQRLLSSRRGHVFTNALTGPAAKPHNKGAGKVLAQYFGWQASRQAYEPWRRTHQGCTRIAF